MAPRNLEGLARAETGAEVEKTQGVAAFTRRGLDQLGWRLKGSRTFVTQKKWGVIDLTLATLKLLAKMAEEVFYGRMRRQA